MLNCEYCGNVIKEDEKFYNIGNDYCCKDCVLKEHITVYRVCGEDYYEDDDVNEYDSINEYIEYLNRCIKFHNEVIKTNNKSLGILTYEKEIKYLKSANEIHKRNKIKYEKELENFKNLLKENIDNE